MWSELFLLFLLYDFIFPAYDNALSRFSFIYVVFLMIEPENVCLVLFAL